MPAILGANSVSGYEISNSLIFNRDDTPHLSHTPSSDGNRQIMTFSWWMKLGELMGANVTNSIFSAGASGSNPAFNIGFNDGNNRGDLVPFQLAILDTTSPVNIGLASDMVFRDYSAWYHCVVAIDTTQGTAANRIKLYVNGEQKTLGANTTYNSSVIPDQNYNVNFNTDDYPFLIGKQSYSTSGNYDGYLAEINFIDGAAKAPSDFGETDDNGVWIPIKYTGTYGQNGFFLEFKQTGTSANASGIGADTSGNGHHYALTDIVATDVTEDTPTNNFAILNHLSNDAEGLNMTEGNLSVTCTTARKNIKASFALPDSGKWYWEWKFNEATGDGAIMNPSIAPVTTISNSSLEASGLFAFWVYTADILYVKYNNGAARSNQNISFGTDDTMQFAVDMNTRRVYLGKNNTWYNTGTGTDADPAAGTGYLATLSSTLEYAPSYAGETTSKTANANFGQKAFAYTPPSGFFALNSTNLAKYG